jgi:hypothetical protein
MTRSVLMFLGLMVRRSAPNRTASDALRYDPERLADLP